jgi:hypothetical protein
MLHEFLVEGASRSHQVALAPHLVMRGNLDFFLHRQSQESSKVKDKDKVAQPEVATSGLAEDFA